MIAYHRILYLKCKQKQSFNFTSNSLAISVLRKAKPCSCPLPNKYLLCSELSISLAMATVTFSTRSFHQSLSHSYSHHHKLGIASCRIIPAGAISSTLFVNSLSLTVSSSNRDKFHPFTSIVFSSGIGGNDGHGGGGNGGDGGGHDGHDGHGDKDRSSNRSEAILALAEAGRTLESLPVDLAAAIESGKLPGSMVHRYFEFEKSRTFGWLLNFGGFKERLLADDLFLTKVGIECGVGIITKSMAELERRRERITKELDFVFADVVMALVADFMLVWLPAPTVSLRPAMALSAGPISKFLYSCPDNAFQVAFAGTSYSVLQRLGAIVINGAKLCAVGTGASLVGVGVTNTLINARKLFDKSFADDAEDMPVFATSIQYGVYMSVSSNLRYQIIAGVIEQRILEPLLHRHKLILGAICFAVRTGNTFLGSLMWIDYARWIGIQRTRE